MVRISKKYDLIELREIVEDDGLGYAVQHYMSADDIEDPVLAGLWRTAADSLDRISEMLHLYD